MDPRSLDVRARTSWWTWVAVAMMLAAGTAPRAAAPQSDSGTRPPVAAPDGARDFDFEIGRWHTHLRRLAHPLSGSTTWVEYDGTSVVRKIWDGRANLVELEADGPSGHVEALSLRLYNPQSHQWSINAANSRIGTLGVPTVGEFKNGRGEFFDIEDFNGRSILVRNVWSDITPDSCRFEQSFSTDGGESWEVNWIAVDTRLPDDSARRATRRGTIERSAASDPAPAPAHESLGDAWWTGPMLAASGGTLPRGHVLFEPYLYDVTSPHTNGLSSLSYLIYGLVDRLSVGLIPTFGFNAVRGGASSSGIGLGDLTALAQFRLTQFHPGSQVPTASLVLEETFPTGRYDRLGARPANGLGSGAYATLVGLYMQSYEWLPNGRILRLRLDLSGTLPGRAMVDGVSVYGTASDFHGHASPGRSFVADAAAEYSLTRSWVLAVDVPYRHAANTRLTGYALLPTGGSPARAATTIGGGNDVWGAAPAIEYNWKPTIGVLLGTRVLFASRNGPASVTPAVAINIVR